MNKLFEFSSNENLINQLSQRIVDYLVEDIEDKGFALLAVSGGSSPKPLFETLRQQELDWNKVTIVLVDERWVDASHDDSNEAMVKAYLLQDNAANANFIGWTNSAETVEHAANIANEKFQKLTLPFSAIILGMGTDGHTASWFADAPEFETLIDSEQTPEVCSAQPQQAPHKRLTLNLSAILQTKGLFLQLSGMEKKFVLSDACPKTGQHILPISYLLTDDSVLEIYWAAA